MRQNRTTPPEPLSLISWVAGALVFATLVSLIGFWLVSVLSAGDLGWTPWSGHDQQLDLDQRIKSSATVAGAASAAVAIALALRRQRTLELGLALDRAQDERDAQRLERERLSQLRDRYTTVAEQLGNDAVTVRLGGVYAAAALVDEWLEEDGGHGEAQTCLALITAYLRLPVSDESSVGDAQVRASAARVIANGMRREESDDGTQHPGRWSHLDIDLNGATFVGPAGFNDTWFKGSAIFSRSTFTDEAHFSGAVFENDARFGGTTFERHAHFAGARFLGDAMFAGVTFVRNAVFNGARFSKGGDFGGTDHSRTTFRGADVPHPLKGPWDGLKPPETWPVPPWKDGSNRR